MAEGTAGCTRSELLLLLESLSALQEHVRR
jgi:hypothetical protein